MVFFCHVLLARVPPRCVSLCRSPEMIFHGHPWLLKVVRPGSPLNEEPRPTLLYYHYWSIIFLIFFIGGESIIQIDKRKLGLPAGGRCYQPNAVIAWRIPGEHRAGFRRLICRIIVLITPIVVVIRTILTISRMHFDWLKSFLPRSLSPYFCRMSDCLRGS